MREIKFRAWDSRNRIMEKGINVLDNEFDDMVTHFQDAQYVCMQYTGLKDKNGKEIYEGDLVSKVKSGKEVVEEVHYSGAAFHGLSNLLDCEVVGNIYESK